MVTKNTDGLDESEISKKKEEGITKKSVNAKEDDLTITSCLLS